MAGPHPGGRSGGDGKWLDSGCIFKTEPIGPAEGLGGGVRGRADNDSEVLARTSGRMELPLAETGSQTVGGQ